MTAISEEYLKQPYPLTTLRGDLTKSQTNILVAMNETLREKIGELMKNKKEGMKLFNQEDLDENGNIVIDVPLSSLTCRPDEYRDVDKVAPLLINARTQIDRGDGIEYFNAFTSVFVPKTRGKEGRRVGSVRIIMSQYQANTLFDFTRFTQYLPLVAHTSKSVFTSRIYMLLASERFRGKCRFGYEELRNILGFNTYDENRKVWVRGEKYAVYKNFKYRVLATAEKELKEFADENKSDLYFTYTEVYEGKGNLRMDPVAIEFTIITTSKGKEADMRAKNTMRYIAFEEYMTENFGLSKKDCQSVLCKVEDDMAEQFEVRMKEICASMLKSGEKIKDRRKYALKCLHDAVEEFVPVLEEEDSLKIERERGGEDTNGKTVGNGGGRTDSRTVGNGNGDATKEGCSEEELRMRISGVRGYKMYLSQTPMRVEEGMVVFDYPHEEVRAWVEANRGVLERCLDMKIK